MAAKRKPSSAVTTSPKPRAKAVSTPAPSIAVREVSAPEPVVAQAIAIEAASVVEDVITPITETVVEAAAPATAQKEKKMDTNTKAQAMFGDISERAKAAFSKGSSFATEMTEFSKGNVEAIVESSKIAASGLQTLGQDAAEYGRKSFENATTAFKSMASVKSPTDLAKLHSDYVRSAFGMMVAETSKSTEAMLKLAGEVAQPLSNRFAVAAEKVKIAA